MFRPCLALALVVAWSLATSMSTRAAACVAPPAGTAGWWTGDGQYLDYAGSHTGVPAGGVSFVPGQVSQAFHLNGSSGYVDLGSWFNHQVFTVAMWVRAGASQVSYADIIDNNHSGTRSWVIQHDNTSDTTNSYFQFAGIRFGLAKGVWQWLAVTVDSKHLASVYLNGGLVGTAQIGTINYDGTQALRLGAHVLYGRYFNGDIDELLIATRALSSGELSALYAAGTSGMCHAAAVVTAPSDQAVATGRTTTLSGLASGEPTVGYQWLFNGTPLTDDTRRTGWQTASLTIANAQYSDAGGYQLVVTNALGAATSAPAVLTVLAPEAYADVVADFSTNTNPNGVWSYGWSTNAGDAFQLMTHRINPAAGVTGYDNNLAQPDSCFVWRNATGNAMLLGGTVRVDPDTLLCDPQGHAGIMRFTAPADGTYQVQGLFRMQNTITHAHDLAIHINTNIVAYYVYTQNGQLGTEYPFDFPVRLQAGQPLDFIVSCHSGDYVALATGVKATVRLLTNATTPQQFDVTTDFRTNANPNGVWSYGVFTNLGGAFGLLTLQNYPVAGEPRVVAWWNGGSLYPSATSVNITGDLTPNPYSQTRFPNVIYYPDTVHMDPENYAATIRFTPPADGVYSVAGFFRVQDTTLYYRSRGAIFRIDLGGTTNSPLFLDHSTGASLGARFPFSFTNSLSQGVPLDFIVACDNGQYEALSSGLSAQLTPLSPVIQTPPASQWAAPGDTATFSVSAWGSTPMSWQWFKGSQALVDGGSVSGSTTSQLRLGSLTLADQGNYRVVLTNAFGAATSSWATLTVLTPPQMQSPYCADGKFNVDIPTSAGVPGSLLQTTNLTAPDWVVCTNWTGNGSILHLAVPMGTEAQRFFRVRIP